ncbi:hypothetical protein ACEH47_002591 [Vibrio cholerae]
MNTSLTKEMMEIIKKAIGIEGMNFKVGRFFDLWESSSSGVWGVLCKSEKTECKWVFLGHSESGPYRFESKDQASLFIEELEKEISIRLSESE